MEKGGRSLPLDDNSAERGEHNTCTQYHCLKTLIALIKHVTFTFLAAADQISVKLLE